jgi:hypothetical protein
MGIASFFSGLFKAPAKAVDIVGDLASGAVSGIDKLFLTPEEKQDFSREVMKVWLDVQKVTAGESSIRSITRRLLAVSFCVVYLSLLITSCVVWHYNPDYSKQIFNVSQELNTPVLTIIIFYFGYYAVSNVIKSRNVK